MKILALVATLFFAYASGEAFFGALRIDAASNERLKAVRTKTQTLAFDVAALQEERRPAAASLPEYDGGTLLELERRSVAETSAYEDFVTWFFLEHKAQAAFEDVPTSLAPAPLADAAGQGGLWTDAYAVAGHPGAIAAATVIAVTTIVSGLLYFWIQIGDLE